MVQIKGNSINCFGFLKFVVSYRDGHNDDPPRAPMNVATPLLTSLFISCCVRWADFEKKYEVWLKLNEIRLRLMLSSNERFCQILFILRCRAHVKCWFTHKVDNLTSIRPRCPCSGTTYSAGANRLFVGVEANWTPEFSVLLRHKNV